MKPDRLETSLDMIARECLAVRVRRLSRVITKIYDDALRPCGLKVSQLNVLVAAGKFGLARPQAVCRLLQMDTSTLSRNVERMRGRGWLEVVAGDDARTQPFRLTPAGKRLLERATPAWMRAQAQARGLLGKGGVAWLSAATQALKA